ncbi:MAG: hypothetical protein QN120_14360 [Armatimonadota bacterium]|nr:hypothetical protein [Armatimonadota bacterium]
MKELVPVVALLLMLVPILVYVELARRHIRTRSLQIVDAAGVVRIALGVAREGAAVVNVFDAAGTARVVAGVHPQGPAFVSVRDERGGERITLAHYQNGPSGVTLPDSTGAVRAGLLVAPDDSVELSLLDARRGHSAGLQAWDDGVRFIILDSRQRERFEARVTADTEPRLRLVDSTGTPLLESPGRGRSSGHGNLR